MGDRAIEESQSFSVASDVAQFARLDGNEIDIVELSFEDFLFDSSDDVFRCIYGLQLKKPLVALEHSVVAPPPFFVRHRRLRSLFHRYLFGYSFRVLRALSSFRR